MEGKSEKLLRYMSIYTMGSLAIGNVTYELSHNPYLSIILGLSSLTFGVYIDRKAEKSLKQST